MAASDQKMRLMPIPISKDKTVEANNWKHELLRLPYVSLPVLMGDDKSLKFTPILVEGSEVILGWDPEARLGMIWSG